MTMDLYKEKEVSNPGLNQMSPQQCSEMSLTRVARVSKD